jgi:HAMP domain-containing protein
VKLEQTISVQNRAVLEEKRQLEEAIRSIIETHTAVANGNYEARVPVNKANVLWPLAGALNNLLSRVQIWRRDSLEMAQMRMAVAQLIKQAGEARDTGKTMTFSRTGTMLDPLLTQLRQLQQTQYIETGERERTRLKAFEQRAIPVTDVSRWNPAKRRLQGF